MDKYIDSNGVRITVNPLTIKVDATAQHPRAAPLEISIIYQGLTQTINLWDPTGPGYTIGRPIDSDINCEKCDVVVRRGLHTLCQWRSGTKMIIQQNGTMKCVACSDSRLRPGHQFVGKDKLGIDQWIVCPECRGESVVPRYKYIDPDTGKEIDYEQQDRLVT